MNGSGLWLLFQIVVRKFPYTLAKIVPNIQTNFMTKTKTGYLLRKPEYIYILEALANTLQTNPRIALYCWSELLLPTLLNSATEQSMCEIAIKFVEVLDQKNGRKSFKLPVGNNENFTIEDAIPALIQHLNSTVRQKTIQPRLRTLFKKIVEMSVFYTSNLPRYYFPKLLPLVSPSAVKTETQNPKETKEEGEDQKEQKAALNLLAMSLLRDSQCHKILLKNYTQYQTQTEQILQHVANTWNKLTPSVKPKRLQDATHELIDTCNNIIDTNNKILQNKYHQDGKQIGVRTLGFSREQLETTNSACQTLLKSFQKAVKAQQPRRRLSCCFIFVIVIVVVFSVFMLYKYKYFVIPTEYVEMVDKYVPKEAKKQIQNGIKVVQSKVKERL